MQHRLLAFMCVVLSGAAVQGAKADEIVESRVPGASALSAP
jgi:hypothetical protein